MAAAGVLPTYQRYVNGVPVPASRKTLRLREKYIILLVFVTFGTVCFGAFFFLPNLQDRVTMVAVQKQFQNAGQDLFFPKHEDIEKGEKMKRHDGVVDPHKIDDKIRLQINIENAVLNMKQTDNRPITEGENAMELKLIREEKEKILLRNREEEEKKKQEEKQKALQVQKDHSGHPGAQGGQPADPEVKGKRDRVKQVSCTAVLSLRIVTLTLTLFFFVISLKQSDNYETF